MDKDTITSTMVAVSSSRLPSRCPTSASVKGWLAKLFYEEMSTEDLKIQNSNVKINRDKTNKTNHHSHNNNHRYHIHSQNRLLHNHLRKQISPWKLDKTNHHRRHHHRTNRFDHACGLEANDDLQT